MATQPIEVPGLVGFGSAQTLLCSTIALPEPSLEIKEIRKTVIVDACAVVPEKVIIDGRLRCDINFTVMTSGTFPRVPGTAAGCGGIVSQASGPVLHTTVEVAFVLGVPVPGALPGDACRVLQAFVEGGAEEQWLFDKLDGYHFLNDKSVVFICLKVTRHAMLAITGATPVSPPICPPGLTAGDPSGAVATLGAAATPGTIAGSFVGPVVTFPGPTTQGVSGIVVDGDF